MFEFLFDDKVDYNYNRKMSLNAIRLSEKVKHYSVSKSISHWWWSVWIDKCD